MGGAVQAASSGLSNLGTKGLTGGGLGGITGQSADLAQKALGGLGGDYIFGGELAGKMGLGKYKPGAITPDAGAFTDRTLADQQKAELEAQREAAKTKTFDKVSAATLGQSTNMTAAQLAEAERIAAAQISPEQQAQIRARQMSLADALTAQAAGQGPSLAGRQLADARNQQIQTAMALAASQRGLTAGQGLRSIADQTTAANQFAASEAAKQRIAEQLSAREQLAGVLSGARTQDIGLATSQAGLAQQAAMANQAAANNASQFQATLDQQANAANMQSQNQFALQQAALNQQANLANQSAGLQQQQLNQNYINALNQQILGVDQNAQNNLMDLERLRAQIAMGQQGLESGAFGDYQKRLGSLIGGLGQAGSSASSMFGGAGGAGATGAAASAAPVAAAASDERLKKNIRSGDREIGSFLDAIGSSTYEYKDKKWGGGKYASPMAQELERSELGKGMVIDTPSGKMVDYARGAGTYLAAAAMLNKRLKRIEKKLGAK